MTRKQRRREEAPCTYCGVMAEVEREHVVPRCLFTPPLPNNLPTVPACRTCNEVKSRDEGYLRDMLALDLNGSRHPVAQALLTGKVRRSVARPGSLLGQAIAKGGWTTDVQTPSGISLPNRGFAVPVDPGWSARPLSMIVRGLYYRARQGQRPPEDYTVEITRVPPGQLVSALQDFRQLFPYGTYDTLVLGERVFVGCFAFLPSDRGISTWVLMFYEQVLFLGFTTPPATRLTALLAAESSSDGV